jgi:hypothetical protein
MGGIKGFFNGELIIGPPKPCIFQHMLDGTPILDIKPHMVPPDGWDQRFL